MKHVPEVSESQVDGMNSYGDLADDYMNLSTEMALPTARETVF